MLKSIKIKPEVYAALERIAERRETFGETIMRLTIAYEGMMQITHPKPPGKEG